MTAAGQDITDDAFLGGALTLKQPKSGYRAGLDAVLLAAVCPAEHTDTVLELGCGVGAALFCLGHRKKCQLTGVERNASIAELARLNASENDLKAEIFTADIASLPPDIRQQRFDFVLMNPPFFESGSRSTDEYRAGARHEDTPLAQWIDCGLKRLAPRGAMILIHRAERLTQLLSLLNSHAVSVEIKPIVPRATKPASRVILRVRRRRSITTTLHNPLILHDGPEHRDDKDGFSAATEAILRHGQALDF